MSGITPNTLNITKIGAGIARSEPVVVHPEYRYWREDWTLLRDVLAGQREVKRKLTTYLPKIPGMDTEEFAIYVQCATFYNMTRQTLTGMVGQAFRKNPAIDGLPKKFKTSIHKRFAKDLTGHIAFCKTVVSEQIAMGRFGALVDVPETPSTTPTPYAVGYTAENIIDWTIQEVNGFFVLTRVLLREFQRIVGGAAIGESPAQTKVLDVRRRAGQSNMGGTLFDPTYVYKAVYRELLLEPEDDGTWVYKQRVHDEGYRVTGYTETTPTVRQVPLNFIPFMFFGATANMADVEPSPILDIADLNISHYRTYAELEHGRRYTALPTYYAPGGDGEGAGDYHIGPARVWEVPAEGGSPGILEYKGEGLKTLERALDTKEQQISAIGGRMLPGGRSVSESNNQTVVREANEQAVLLNVLCATEVGMAELVRWWLMWQDVPLSQTEDLDYDVSKDFISNPAGAREMRAMQLMFEAGIITIEQLYDFLISADVISAETSFSDFQNQLKDPNSFVNNPDAQARQRGYTDRKQELEQATRAREFELQQQELDLEERQVVLEENAPPPPPPVVKAPIAAGPNPRKAKVVGAKKITVK